MNCCCLSMVFLKVYKSKKEFKTVVLNEKIKVKLYFFSKLI